MKKKLFSLTIGIAALALLASCGGSSKSKSKDNESKSSIVESSGSIESNDESKSSESKSSESNSNESKSSESKSSESNSSEASSTSEVDEFGEYDMLLSNSYFRINMNKGKIESMVKFSSGLTVYVPVYNKDGKIEYLKSLDFESNQFYSEIDLGDVGQKIRFFYDDKGNFNIVEFNTDYQTGNYGSQIYNGGSLNNIIIDNKGNITKNLSSNQSLNSNSMNYNITDDKVEITKNNGEKPYKFIYDINDGIGNYSAYCGKELLHSVSIDGSVNKLTIQRSVSLSVIKKAKANDFEVLEVTFDDNGVIKSVDFTDIFNKNTKYVFQYGTNNRISLLTATSDYSYDSFSKTYTYYESNKVACLLDVENGYENKTYYNYDTKGNLKKEVYDEIGQKYSEVLEYDKYLNPIVTVENIGRGKQETHYEYDAKYRRIHVQTYLYKDLVSTEKYLYQESGYTFDKNDNVIVSFNYGRSEDGSYYNYSYRTEMEYDGNTLIGVKSYGPDSTYKKLELKNNTSYDYDDEGCLVTVTNYSNGQKTSEEMSYGYNESSLFKKISTTTYEYYNDAKYNYVLETHYEYDNQDNQVLKKKTTYKYEGKSLEEKEVILYDYEYKSNYYYVYQDISVIDKEGNSKSSIETNAYSSDEYTSENLVYSSKYIYVDGRTYPSYVRDYVGDSEDIYEYKIVDEKIYSEKHTVKRYDDGSLVYHGIEYFEYAEDGACIGVRVDEYDFNEDGTVKALSVNKYKDYDEDSLYYRNIISYAYDADGRITGTSTLTMNIDYKGETTKSTYSASYVYSKLGDCDVVKITKSKLAASQFVITEMLVYTYLDDFLVEEEKYNATNGVINTKPVTHFEYSYKNGLLTAAECIISNSYGEISYTYDENDKLVETKRVYEDGSLLTVTYDEYGYTSVSEYDDEYNDLPRHNIVSDRYEYFLGDEKLVENTTYFEFDDYRTINGESVKVAHMETTQVLKPINSYTTYNYLVSVEKKTTRYTYVDGDNVTQIGYYRHSYVTYDESGNTTHATVSYDYEEPKDGVSYSREEVTFDYETYDDEYIENSVLKEYDESDNVIRETHTSFVKEKSNGGITFGERTVITGDTEKYYEYDIPAGDWVEIDLD